MLIDDFKGGGKKQFNVSIYSQDQREQKQTGIHEPSSAHKEATYSYG